MVTVENTLEGDEIDEGSWGGEGSLDWGREEGGEVREVEVVEGLREGEDVMMVSKVPSKWVVGEVAQRIGIYYRKIEPRFW